jgi:hypothetical protein
MLVLGFFSEFAAGCIFKDCKVLTNGHGNGSVAQPPPIWGHFNEVSDSLVLPYPSAPVGQIETWFWTSHGGVPQDVEYIISSEHSGGGTVFGSGEVALTATYLFTNQFGFDVFDTFMSFPELDLHEGSYWLSFTNGQSTSGDLYWDINLGVGCDFPSCPAQAWFNDEFEGQRSETFTLYEPVPEPSTLVLIGGGFAGMLLRLRRKL